MTSKIRKIDCDLQWSAAYNCVSTKYSVKYSCTLSDGLTNSAQRLQEWIFEQ